MLLFLAAEAQLVDVVDDLAEVVAGLYLVFDLAEDRITSYNVCYTKLLRGTTSNRSPTIPKSAFEKIVSSCYN